MSGASAVSPSETKVQQGEDFYNALDDNIIKYLHPEQ
jgi:hypothetical protein